MKLAALIAKDLVFPLAGCDQASDVLGALVTFITKRQGADPIQPLSSGPCCF